jgi:hypothetical protein
LQHFAQGEAFDPAKGRFTVGLNDLSRGTALAFSNL